MLTELKQRGYTLGIISNTPWGSPATLWRAELHRHGLMDCINEALFCVDAGRRKPHKDIFDYALTTLKLSAEETVFVGDDPVWDVAGAKEAGLRPILLDPNALPSSTEQNRIAHLMQLLGYL